MANRGVLLPARWITRPPLSLVGGAAAVVFPLHAGVSQATPLALSDGPSCCVIMGTAPCLMGLAAVAMELLLRFPRLERECLSLNMFSARTCINLTAKLTILYVSQ